MSSRLFRGAAGMAVAWALLGVGHASAQTPSDPVPPGTVILGPIQIRPSIILREMGLDENVFNEPVDPKRDFTFTLSPSAEVRFRMRRLRLAYVSNTEYVYYRKYRSERGTNTSSVVRLEFDLGRMKPHGSITGLNSRSRLNAEVDARARHRDLTYSAGVGFRIASRTTVAITGTQATVTYAPDATFRGVDLRQSFDGRRRAADAGISVQLTPITAFTASVAREQQRFDLSPDRNSNSWRVTSGFGFNPAGLIAGGAAVGYRRFQPVSPTLPGYSGLVSNVAVNLTLRERHHVQVLFNRDVQYSYETENAYYVGTGGTVTWTLSVVGPLDVRGVGGRYQMDYGRGGGIGADTTTTYGGGVGYKFSNRARLGANIEWSRRDSSRAAERGYSNHRLFVGLTWGTQ